MRPHRILFFLLLALLPTQLGLHFWPSWAMVLGRRVDYLSPTLYLTDIFVLVTIVSWFISYIHVIPAPEPGSINRVTIKTGFRVKPGMTTVSFLILLFILINIYISANKPEAIYTWIKLVEFGLLGLYIVKNKPGLSLIASGLAIGVIYSSLLALVQFILQSSVGGLLWWLGERTFNVSTPGIARVNFCLPFSQSCSLLLRPYATFPHPNVLGGFLALAIPLIIYQFTNPTNLTDQFKQFNNVAIKQWLKNGWLQKLFLGISIIVGFIGLILTFSRSGIAVGAMGIIMSAWVTIRSKLFKKLLLLTGITMIFFTLFQFRNIALTDESIVVREQLNTAAVKLWTESPIFGMGLGNFLVKLPEALPSRTVYFLQPVHNIYLLILTETGIAGFAFFVWLIRKIFKNFLILLRKSDKDRSGEKIIVYTCLYLLLAVGFIDHYPLDLQQGQLLFTILLALALTH